MSQGRDALRHRTPETSVMGTVNRISTDDKYKLENWITYITWYYLYSTMLSLSYRFIATFLG